MHATTGYETSGTEISFTTLHTNSYFDDMIHKRAGLYLVSHVCSKHKHDLQFRRIWETQLKQAYRLNAVICSSEIELKVAKKFKTN